MKRMMPLVLAALFATAMFQTPAAAVTRQITLGAGYATASVMTSSTAAQFTGAASWHKQYPGAKAESYIDVAATFGTTFTVGQIASVSYHTLAPVVNPSGVDFTMLFYTQPFVGGDASWYGRRLTSEPYLSNGYVAQVPNAWSTWKTGAGANQLTFYDSNHCGNQGFYGSPTLANLGSGPIDWAAWPGNPTAGSATGGAIDYASQPVKFLSFQTGSGWASFNGYLDAITVTLTNGDVYVLDLEGTADPVYANGAWAGSGQGVEVAPGRFFGFNAFATVQTAVNAAIPGGTVEVAAGTFTEQVVVNGKNLTIHGAGRSSTILQSPVTLAASFSTPTVNRPIVLCENAADIRVVNLRVDGAGRGNGNARFIGVGFWNAGGKVIDCDVVHVRETPFNGVQSGVGVYSFDNTGGPYAIEIGNCAISDYQKNAMALNGPGITVNVHDCTAAGVGGTNLIAQNGIQIAFGAGGTVSRCNVSDICYLPNTTVGCAFLFYSGTGVSSDALTVSNGQVGSTKPCPVARRMCRSAATSPACRAPVCWCRMTTLHSWRRRRLRVPRRRT